MRIISITAAACVAFAAPAFAQTTTMAPDYVKMAGASDQFEIQSAKVEMTTKNPKLKQFAQQMVTDHTKSTQMVKAAAMKDHVAVHAPMLNADQKQMLAQLKAAKGTARDQLYVQQQTQSHQMALQLQQGYAQGGDKQNLMMAAQQIVPVVQSHIDMLNGMGSMSAM